MTEAFSKFNGINEHFVLHIRTLLEQPEESAWVSAAKDIIYATNQNVTDINISTREEAEHIIKIFNQLLLERDQYEWSALLLWGPKIFSAKPRSVQMILNSVRTDSKILIMGAGSMGKSYSIGVWTLLDWIKDPHFTAVRVISATARHAKDNLFNHICELHGSAIIPLPGKVWSGFISISETKRKYAISQLSIPQGKSGKGRLRGLHPDPRPKEFDNPKYNGMARIRIILDEAEEIPGGIWEDIANILLTKLGPENIKIIAATNPKDPASEFGKRAEPEKGWMRGFDLEESEVWISARGWKVIRLDGKKCENVISGQDLYPGLLTKEGYNEATKDAGGEGTPTWYTMCRGSYPIQGSISNLISPAMLSGIVGRFSITNEYHNCLAADLALEGGDSCTVGFGIIGTASGFTPNLGAYEHYANVRKVVQLEQIFKLPRGNTVNQALKIKEIARNLNVSPKNVILDRTGNGSGVHDYLKETWSGEVVGLDYRWKATDMKILVEDSFPASELYDGIVTEICFVLQKFIEFEVFKISPIIDTAQLFKEMTSRKFAIHGSKTRIQAKSEFKKDNNGKSPDDFDMVTLLCQLARVRGYLSASMQKDLPPPEKRRGFTKENKVGKFDKLKNMY